MVKLTDKIIGDIASCLAKAYYNRAEIEEFYVKMGIDKKFESEGDGKTQFVAYFYGIKNWKKKQEKLSATAENLLEILKKLEYYIEYEIEIEPDDNKETGIKFDNILNQNINYFGVAYSPYFKNGPNFPNWDTYTINEIKQMLKILSTNHNNISTYSMGVAGYNEGKPWERADSNCLISRAAAYLNLERNFGGLSVAQGIYQIPGNQNLQNREIENAFLASEDANNIWRGTVWGLIFTNVYVSNWQTGNEVLQMIRNNKDRAHSMGLKVGPRIDNAGEIWNGPNKDILIQIAKESDFIMCNIYPHNFNDVAKAIQSVSDQYYSARDRFWQHNNQLEVMIGETGWASQGRTFNNPPENNNIDNMKNFWWGMKDWSNQNRVKIYMFEGFNEPWKTGEEGEKHLGWWYRPDNNRAVYIEKATGREFT